MSSALQAGKAVFQALTPASQLKEGGAKRRGLAPYPVFYQNEFIHHNKLKDQ